ncbi:hypothetical protein K6119_14375 [Paracrocinitomix mangrovi]|uniref:hypothetical protein n=1 Tax=Paracrocinitomix mangrovi TaxID=2862509 RepID=UPI001C8EA8D3|nr:hypothetical protein [Paracrocinitomix mangrovi]UKN00917.1 hypothetical protein K6119_14375 [Paracrocinitomix mangrovi]
MAKEVNYIYFKKKQSERTFKLKLPLKCRIYPSDEDKRFGKIVDYNDSIIHFEYKDYDTSHVSEILKIDSLGRKEKYDLVDSLIEHSKVIQKIPHEKILKISVLSGSDNLSREIGILVASLGVMASATALLISRSQKVGSSWDLANYLELSGIGISVGAMAILYKRNINMEKWEFHIPK